ncbi:SAV_2336 N-terminal domain-related protein [Streptomyces sp. NPDC057838]|uniref:SAV_2336 N-terminal domain-related protein n=1 Tax=unclassified Streptomyces TaxID=2593676 RepID=UPI00367BCB97
MTAHRTGPADVDGDELTGALTDLVGRMRAAGLAPSAQEVADALWLARWVGPGDGGPPDRPEDTSALRHRPSYDQDETTRAADPKRTDTPRRRLTAESARLLAPAAEGGPGSVRHGHPVRVPNAPMLPDPLGLQRALRPLQRYQAPVAPVRHVLDEQATAERAADTGLLVPVLGPRRRRRARLLLLMDVSTSTVVWESTFQELREVCERAGVFSEVKCRYLQQTPSGALGLSHEPSPEADLLEPAQSYDASGRQLTLVLSDCAGPLWRSGRMQRLLHHWSSAGPLAVIQPMPQRMWQRTHLPARPGVLHRSEGPVGRLRFTPARGGADGEGTAVPVLALRRSSVEGWARLVSGTTGQSLHAAAGLVRSDHPAARTPAATRREITAADRVRAFRRSASPSAWQLAVYLVGVPLTLPVMRLTQRAMMASSGPEVLAEVLLSGLLGRGTDQTEENQVTYVFLPGVREELCPHLSRSEAELIYKHVSAYVTRRFGRSARNFPALAAAVLSGRVEPSQSVRPTDEPPMPHALRPFADVSTQLLRDFLARSEAALSPSAEPAPAAGHQEKHAREALSRFRENGSVEDLNESIRLIRSALGAEPQDAPDDSVLHELLAEALLERWRAWHLPEDLRDAYDAAAQVRTDTPGVHVTTAWTLSLMADEVRSGARLADLAPAALIGDAQRPTPEETVDRLLELAVQAAALVHSRPEPPAGSDDFDIWYTSILLSTHTLRRRAAIQAFLDDVVPTRTAELLDGALVLAERLVDIVDRHPGGVAGDPPTSGRWVRGTVRLAQARHFAGLGPDRLPDEETDRGWAQTLAVQAVEDYRDVVSHESAEPRDWLGLAEALKLLSELGWDQASGEDVLDALEEARQRAGEDEELQAECFAAKAEELSRQSRSLDDAASDRAVEAWRAALRLSGDHAQRTHRLSTLGNLLAERATMNKSLADSEEGVRLLRESVERSGDDGPDAGFRRVLLGRALSTRGKLSGAVSDQHEADWLLGSAVKTLADSPIECFAWLFRGDAAAVLAKAAPESSREFEDWSSKGARYYLSAADCALAEGMHDLAIGAARQRALLLARAFGVAQPLKDLRDFRRRLEAEIGGGRPDHRMLQRLDKTISDLESGTVRQAD